LVFYCGQGHDPIYSVQFQNNKVSTKFLPLGGRREPKAYAPTWGKDGNLWQGNTWHDGPRAGQGIL
jgi:hypothetical protein